MFYLQHLYVIKIDRTDLDQHLKLWIPSFPIIPAGVAADIRREVARMWRPTEPLCVNFPIQPS